MKIWSLSFLLLFGSIEFYQWLRAMEIPLPVYISLGILLAIASNLAQIKRSPFSKSSSKSSSPAPSSISESEPRAKIIPKPPLPSPSQSQDSISFTIKSPEKIED
jgi:hypothetical protein